MKPIIVSIGYMPKERAIIDGNKVAFEFCSPSNGGFFRVDKWEPSLELFTLANSIAKARHDGAVRDALYLHSLHPIADDDE